MARGQASASAAGRARPRGVWIWLGLGWLGVLAWLAMIAMNAAPYFSGRPWPSGSDVLGRLLAPPAALGLPPALAAHATPLITTLAIFFIIVVTALSISSRSREAVATVPAVPVAPAVPASAPEPLANPAPQPAPTVEVAPEPPTAIPTGGTAAPFTPWVFISHSSRDDDFGKRLNADLRAMLARDEPGRVWYDSAPERGEEVAEGTEDAASADASAQPGGLRGGMNFPREIVKQIAMRNVMIVILSPEATRSRWVKYEIDQAINRYNGPERFAIYPLVYRACALPHALSIFQTLDFTSADTDPAAYQRQLAELVALMRGGRVNLSESAPPFELGALPPPERLIGRGADLEWTLARLRARETTAVTAIGGMGGIGKSALAAVAVRLLRQERAFPDGIVAVSCENQTDPVVVLRAALTPFTAGQRPPNADTLPALGAIAANLLEGKRALIALDNIEPDLRVEQVTTPLTDAGATLLLTARQMLPTAAVPRDGVRRLDLLSPEDALLLFAQSYGRSDADALTAEERESATRIVSLLDRHTLAVRLAGAYAAEMNRPLPRVADEIAADTLDIPDGETPRKVDAVLKRSIEALPPDEQRLFAALTVFATGEFGRKAALALAEGLALSDPRGGVELLVRRALLDASVDTSLPTDADPERLRLHPLFQAEAAPRFAAWPAADREAALRAVAAWYARYTASNRFRTHALLWDQQNILGALEWAQTSGADEEYIAICSGMHHSFALNNSQELLTHLPRAIGIIEKALSESEGSDSEDVQSSAEVVVQLMISLANELTLRGQNREAIEILSRAQRYVNLYSEMRGSTADLYRITSSLQAIQGGQLFGIPTRAEDFIPFAASPEMRSMVNGLGTDDISFNSAYRQVIQEYLSNLYAFANGTDQDMATTWAEAIQAVVESRWIDASSHFERTVQQIRESRDLDGLDIVYLFLGQVAIVQREWERAEAYLHTALQVADEIGVSEDLDVIYRELGTIEISVNEPAEAVRLYLKALREAESQGNEFRYAHMALDVITSLSQHGVRFRGEEHIVSRAAKYFIDAGLATEAQRIDTQFGPLENGGALLVIPDGSGLNGDD